MKSSSKILQPLVTVLTGILITVSTPDAFSQSTQDKFIYQDNQRINKRNNVVVAWYDVNSRIYQGTPEQIARQFLDENKQQLGIADLTDLEFMETIQSPAGSHVAFRQRYRNIPVFASETVVSINHENRVSMVMNGHAPIIGVPNVIPRVVQSVAIASVKTRLQVDEKTFITQPNAELVIYQDSLDVYHLAWKVRFNAGRPYGDWEGFVDAHSGDIIFIHDISVHYVNGTGKVFDPDPITALQNTSLTDNNDTDYPEIQGAYDSPMTLQELNDAMGGVYRLQGRYARSEEIEPDQPNGSFTKPPVTNSNTSFLYNRSQAGFEETNVYYFIDTQRRYVGSLGFTPQWGGSDAMRFDAHAEFGADNSHYHSGTSPYLTFGDGGIDDPEDQDVVLHEYGHALHDALMTGTGIGSPTSDQAKISEGSGDYLAVSFRRTRSLFQQDKVFPWDGNGETWNGRMLSSTHKYPQQWTGVHDPAGVLWASTMMDLETLSDIGRNVSTTLLLTSFSFVTQTSLAPDHVQAIFRADRDIPAYNSSHLASIGRVFFNRGFFDARPGVHPSNLISGNITASTTWSSIKWVNGFTFIKSGVTVTVPDNAYLFVDNNQKIIVESGGSLVIQSGARVVCYSSAKIEVNSDGTLTVNGSAVLQFGSGSEILCNGKLIADSIDPAKRITFTGTTATPGSWYGIKINSGSSTNISTLRRCDVQYAIDGVTITYTGNSTNVTIDKCRIRNNLSYGIYVYGTFSATAHPTISNNHIHDNGDGVNLYNYAMPIITGNRIESNLTTGIYGNSSSSATVEFNYVRDSGYGIAFEFNSLAQVHRNTVTACVQGAGMYASSSSNLVAYGSGDNKGRNKITANNADGIESLDCSPVFGKNITDQFGNNQIQDNTLYQAQHSGSGQLLAEQCYWAGQQNDILGNVDNLPYLASVPSPVGWGQSDNYDPSFLIPSKDDFIPTGPISVAHTTNATMAKNGTITNGFDPVAWSAKFGAAMEAGLDKGDWVDAAEVITELWRELQDSRVPLVDYALLASHAENTTVEASIRKYLALTLVEKSLAEQDVSTALTDLAKYGQSNKAHAAELLANVGVIQLHRQNDLTAAQNILAQLQCSRSRYFPKIFSRSLNNFFASENKAAPYGRSLERAARQRSRFSLGTRLKSLPNDTALSPVSACPRDFCFARKFPKGIRNTAC